jgi:hypothetical protein
MNPVLRIGAGATLAAVLGFLLLAAPEERVLGTIVVKTREEAEALTKRIKAGEPFEILALQHSIDPSAPEGGYMGKVKIEDLRQEFQQALANVTAGEVSAPFSIGTGYALLKVLPRPRVPLPRAGSGGGAQTVAYVSGFEESNYFFTQLPKPGDYHQDLNSICALKTTAIKNAIRDAEARAASATDPQESMQAHHMAGQLYASRGEIEKSISHFENALKLAEGNLQSHAQALREKLGIAWLRKGEWDNCVSNHNARSCIFPLTAAARHKMQTGSRRAVEYFVEYLRNEPEDLEVKWLLHLAIQTLGKPPMEIPAAYLLPSNIGNTVDPAREFVDVSHSSGLHRMNNAGGSILDDFDNDGHPDLMISVVNACEAMGFYRNQGDGTFKEQTRQAGLAVQLGGININHADYNNDGLLDVFVMRGGWEFAMRNSLLKNNGDGTFTDVTAAAGLASPAYPTPTSAWADFDNDGFLDLFVGNENAPGQLFRNKGDGTFVDVAPTAGVAKVSFAKGATWGDYDNDGFPDLYVSNYRQENFLYRNNGDGAFTEVAKALGVEGPKASFPTWFFDYDNDGCQDLFVSSYVQSVAEIAKEFLSRPVDVETMKLYRNTCRGGFEDVSGEAGINRVSMAMGANFGDIDNDGFLDFYLGTGSPSYGALVPNLLFRNEGGRRFADVTSLTGTGHLQKGHGIAFGDVDHDGDQDIFLHTGGAVPGDSYGNVLFRNPGTPNHWLRVKLVGRKTNRAAIGARIKAVVIDQGGQPRAIQRVVTSGGSFGSSSFQQHLGLGAAARVQSLEVWWPTSGTRQVFEDISADQAIEITEGQNSYRRRRQ